MVGHRFATRAPACLEGRFGDAHANERVDLRVFVGPSGGELQGVGLICARDGGRDDLVPGVVGIALEVGAVAVALGELLAHGVEPLAGGAVAA